VSTISLAPSSRDARFLLVSTHKLDVSTLSTSTLCFSPMPCKDIDGTNAENCFPDYCQCSGPVGTGVNAGRCGGVGSNPQGNQQAAACTIPTTFMVPMCPSMGRKRRALLDLIGDNKLIAPSRPSRSRLALFHKTFMEMP
jgi:hypothetical protein